MLEGTTKGHNFHEKHKMTPTRQIAISFLAVILVGSILLTLPISYKGNAIPYLDNLFVAVSATCVTGLVPTVTIEHFSLVGQIVILIMIQIGGLGFLTFLNILLIKIRKKLSLSNKLVMQEALNQHSLTDLPYFMRNVLKYTFAIELIGAILLSFQFVPERGLIQGIYYGVFHSISAFCNAGFDIIGASSLMIYADNVLVNLTIAGLIIAGGIGFIVSFDLFHKFKSELKRPTKFNKRHYFSSLTLHTKIVIIVTFILLLLGTVLFYAMEYNNSLKGMTFPNALLTSFFQSVTLRTAGFATVDCAGLNTATKMIMCVFMFIGGSPAGTAGGVKTVTFAISILMIVSIYKGNQDLIVFGKRLRKRLVIRAMTIVAISIGITLTGLCVLSISENRSFIDLCFEVFSAYGTVGLTAGLTPTLTDVGKIVIIILMYIGRIGPIAMMISFARKSQLKKCKKIVYIDEDVLIG